MKCPEHKDIFRFVRGELSTEEVLRIKEHLDGCVSCQEDVGLLKGLALALAVEEKAGKKAAGGQCLNEAEIAAYLTRSAEKKEMERIQKHLAECSPCRSNVLQAYRIIAEVDAQALEPLKPRVESIWEKVIDFFRYDLYQPRLIFPLAAAGALAVLILAIVGILPRNKMYEQVAQEKKVPPKEEKAIAQPAQAERLAPIRVARDFTVEPREGSKPIRLMGVSPTPETTEVNDKALFLAAYNGRTEAVKGLLSQGADVNVKDAKGNTVLMAAAQGGHREVVDKLLSQGADVNAKNKRGSTALMYAAYNGRLKVVKVLLTYHADVKAKNKNQDTALKLAAVKGHKEVVELLKKAGAKE